MGTAATLGAFRSLNPRFKPPGRPNPHPTLLRCATSIWTLHDFANSAKDWKGVNDLTFGTTTARPTWGTRVAGTALTFDGGDDCNGALATSVSAFPVWVACSFYVGSVAASQAAIGLGSAAVANGAQCTIYNTTTNVLYQIRNVDVGTNATATGPTAVVGGVYHCAAISRAQTDHKLFVNGQLFTSATDVGASWTAIVNGAIGELKRSTASALLTGGVHWAAYGVLDPGDAFLQQLSSRPFDLLYQAKPRRRIAGAAAGGILFRRTLSNRIGARAV